MDPSPEDTFPVDELTPRQEEVIRLIESGRSNPQIAEELGLTIDGVKWHVREVISKLGARNRDDAVTIWRGQLQASSRRRFRSFSVAVGTWAGAATVAAFAYLLFANGIPFRGSPLTPAEFFNRVGESLERDGLIVRVEGIRADPPPDGSGKWVVWVDFDNEVAHGVYSYGRGFGPGHTLLVENLLFHDAGSEGLPLPRLYVSCFDTGGDVLAEFVACTAGQVSFLALNTEGALLQTRENVDFEGHPAVEFTLSLPILRSGERGEVIVVADASTYELGEFRIHYPTDPEGEGREDLVLRYKTDYVSRSSLPDNFFDASYVDYGRAIVQYAETLDGPSEPLELQVAYNRLQDALGIKPWLLGRQFEPVVVTEMRANVEARSEPGGTLFTLKYAPPEFAGAPDATIDVAVWRHEGAGPDPDLPHVTYLPSSHVVVRYELAEDASGGDTYAFARDGYEYHLEFKGSNRINSVEVLEMLDNRLTYGSTVGPYD